MAIRKAQVQWTGDFKSGQGTITPESGAFQADYCFGSIFGCEPGTNPMEMLGASIAGCFCGALAAVLTRHGHIPTRIDTQAEVHTGPIEEGYLVQSVHVRARAAVPGVDTAVFADCAETAKRTCPVAQALGAIEITLMAELV